MFKILKDKTTICLTRGDVADIEVSAKLQEDSKPPEEWQPYVFVAGDIVRFSVFKKKDFSCIEIQKDVKVDKETEVVVVHLEKEDTKIGPLINKYVDYWYEVVLNPDTRPQTILGYDDIDEAGEKIFRLFPEGGDPE